MLFCFQQKAAYEMRISDWSSDVCSSDLCERAPVMAWKRVIAAFCILLRLVLAPAVALGGVALWQHLAPESLRQVVLTAAALAEPDEVDRMLERVELGIAERDAR